LRNFLKILNFFSLKKVAIVFATGLDWLPKCYSLIRSLILINLCNTKFLQKTKLIIRLEKLFHIKVIRWVCRLAILIRPRSAQSWSKVFKFSNLNFFNEKNFLILWNNFQNNYILFFLKFFSFKNQIFKNFFSSLSFLLKFYPVLFSSFKGFYNNN
jgi:hypothetical protein